MPKLSSRILFTGIICFFIMQIMAFSSLAQMRSKVLYGEDNRHDLYEISDSNIARASEAVAAMVNWKSLLLQNNEYLASSVSMGRYFPVCSDEKFREQPSLASCSGFLVADNLLMTAGHCVKNKNDCRESAWVFGYQMTDSQTARMSFARQNVYSCKKILVTYSGAQLDYALIQLDRNVSEITPLTVNEKESLAIYDEVFMLGYPLGLPQKFTDQARVRSIHKSGRYFLVNLDAYGGSSGSPVLNSKTLEVEGILVSGEDDFDSTPTCNRSKICDEDGCRGEKVTALASIRDVLSRARGERRPNHQVHLKNQ